MERHLETAVLLATHNGSRFVEQQIKSLADNSRSFTIHWLDDHSDDETRTVVRTAAHTWKVDLREWHQPSRQGIPHAFFRLMECVEADVYLFCDQDDIWQPGKIDDSVANLCGHKEPVLTFSAAKAFRNDDPSVLRCTFEAIGVRREDALQESRLFMFNPAMGNTIGFTRALRDIVVNHNQVAREYAAMHDWWMYLIAMAAGSAQIFPNAPTTLYRMHSSNFSAVYFQGSRWELQQAHRRWAARQARGFLQAAPTLPAGPKLDRFVALATMISTIDAQQSPIALYRLARHGSMPPSITWSAWLSAACLSSDARN